MIDIYDNYPIIDHITSEETHRKFRRSIGPFIGYVLFTYGGYYSNVHLRSAGGAGTGNKLLIMVDIPVR